ncbi:MAG: hypothetical protein HRU76_14785 [Phycisphaeraceae bacterium]|nr:MAG: hypothetical protein HRU76_14785 [Phycisphaeraceae bacterium]
MIFLTVGAQMPFDRLVQAVDRWAGAGPGREVFAQIGDTDFRPSHMAYRASLEPREFAETVQRCRVIVAHAGMGSILSALRAGKPILIFPRRGDLRETRNDHQVATARQMRGRPGVKVALDEAELLTELDRLTATATPTPIQPWASDDLINRIRSFIWSGTRPVGQTLADEANRSDSPTLSDHPHHGIETP